MTTYFVSNAGSNTAPYDTEAKAATSLGTIAALPWTNADVVKISSTHTETAGAAITYAFPTSPGLQLLSVTFNGSGTGGLAAGAAVNIGAASAAFTMTSGFVYAYGITFGGGTNNNNQCDIVVGNSNAALIGYTFDNCVFDINSISTGANLTIGANAGSGSHFCNIRLINCTYIGSSTASILIRNGTLYIQNLTVSGTASTTLFDPSLGNGTLDLTVDASNLAGFAYTNLINAAATRSGTALFRQCKLDPGSALTTGSFAGPGAYSVIAADCDEGDVHYNYRKESYEGSISTSASIYQGAGDGTNSFSLLMTGNANTNFAFPLTSPEIVAFNSTLSSMTTLVEVTNDGTTFTDAQLWQETMAKITSGFTLGTWNVADRAAGILTAGTNQATSSVPWTGTGGFTSEVKQKLESGSFTPAEVGEIVTVVKLAANDNVYVSPEIISTSAKQWLSGSGRFINERASDGGGGGGGSVLGGPFT